MNPVLVGRSTMDGSEKLDLVDRRDRDKVGNAEEFSLIYCGLPACAHVTHGHGGNSIRASSLNG
jgi:hypothetical protein